MLIYDEAVLQMAELRYFFFFALPLKTAGCWDLFSNHPSVSPFCFLIMPLQREKISDWA